MRIELKIDDKNVELQQKITDDLKAVPLPLYDSKILRREDLISEKYNIVPHVFYYTNCLNFKADDREGGFDCVRFFDEALGRSVEFQNKAICLYENLTNMYEPQGFYNRFDLYHIAWEIIEQKSCDLAQKQKIIEYLTGNCCFKISINGRILYYPFTNLSNKLYVNTGSFNRIEAREGFIIKLKMVGRESPQDLLKLLPDTILKIYLYGNYWLEKR